MTNPSRPRSNGREAKCGSALRRGGQLPLDHLDQLKTAPTACLAMGGERCRRVDIAALDRCINCSGLKSQNALGLGIRFAVNVR